MNWAYQSIPELSDSEFDTWQNLLEQRTGISFERHKQILQTGLGQRMREVGCLDYGQYFRQICYGKGGALEWEALLKTLTVKETRFFRDEDAFEYVRKYLFNRLVRPDADKTLEIWSVACSTGEEPYSMAMLANDTIEGLGGSKYYGITATDICLASLADARAGKFGERRVDGIESSMRDRYFVHQDGRYKIVDWLREKICFVQANIIELGHLPIAQQDVVYCQNVLVYFRRWRQHQVLDELAARLKPGGLLVLGSGEGAGWVNPSVRRADDDTVQAYIKIAS
ncbi:Chemotaxis protein methyltransferase 1 [BD1-7 clade bacterium]|uniref:protein-glutamate O-methyltransferase n=1 Tax=BD1-7 clade bacterium TaxID=2029982 RepID=A0A5S9QEF0_9GAMM|nr:Chemotaxis protein methyltransferase 1 [BD1-7 clade bacterium]